jgi:hypothetical protein
MLKLFVLNIVWLVLHQVWKTLLTRKKNLSKKLKWLLLLALVLKSMFVLQLFYSIIETIF